MAGRAGRAADGVGVRAFAGVAHSPALMLMHGLQSGAGGHHTAGEATDADQVRSRHHSLGVSAAAEPHQRCSALQRHLDGSEQALAARGADLARAKERSQALEAECKEVHAAQQRIERSAEVARNKAADAAREAAAEARRSRERLQAAQLTIDQLQAERGWERAHRIALLLCLVRGDSADEMRAQRAARAHARDGARAGAPGGCAPRSGRGS